MVAFKSYKTRERWYSNTAKIEIEIAGRRVKTNSGENPFKYFDGPTMVSYQVPPKAMEIVYCRQVPIPKECEAGEYTYDLEAPNFSLDSFEVKMSGGGENAGRGVFAKVDIPRDAYLSAETSCHQVHFMPPTLELIEAMNNETYAEINSRIVPVEAYMHGYGCTSRSFVSCVCFAPLFVVQHFLTVSCCVSCCRANEKYLLTRVLLLLSIMVAMERTT